MWSLGAFEIGPGKGIDSSGGRNPGARDTPHRLGPTVGSAGVGRGLGDGSGQLRVRSITVMAVLGMGHGAATKPIAINDSDDDSIRLLGAAGRIPRRPQHIVTAWGYRTRLDYATTVQRSR